MKPRAGSGGAHPGPGSLRGASDSALLSGLRGLSASERETVLSILEHLAEIERRRLYLSMGYGSLFEMCVRDLGYCEATAARRVRAARMLGRYPAVRALLSSGRITVSNLVRISRVIDSSNAEELLGRIEGMSAREVDALVSSRRPEAAIRDRVSTVHVRVVRERRGGVPSHAERGTGGNDADSSGAGGAGNGDAGAQRSIDCGAALRGTSACGAEGHSGDGTTGRKFTINVDGKKPVMSLGELSGDGSKEPEKGSSGEAAGRSDEGSAAKRVRGSSEGSSTAPGGRAPALENGRAAQPGDSAAASGAGTREMVLEERFKVSFGAGREFIEKVERVRALLSTRYHERLRFEQLFGILLDEYIERHSPEARLRRRKEREEKRALKEAARAASAGGGKARKVESRTDNDKGRSDSSEGPCGSNDASLAGGGNKRNEVKPLEPDACVRGPAVGTMRPGQAEVRAGGGTRGGKASCAGGVSRRIPRRVRDEVYARDGGRCTFVSPGGRRCGSTHDLQIDHIVPFARGGDDSPSNLRLLCGRHNRLEAERAYGKAFMERFLDGGGREKGSCDRARENGSCERASKGGIGEHVRGKKPDERARGKTTARRT